MSSTTAFRQGIYQFDWARRVVRWLDAMPQYGPGHADVVAEVRAGLPPTLAVAGSYLDGIGVPACVGVPLTTPVDDRVKAG